MAFCPRCGAATQPSMSFCSACGGPLAPQAPAAPPQASPTYAPPSTATPAYAPAPAYTPAGYAPLPARATGPMGRVMEPWLVVLLMFVTLGIYSAFYWWRVSREVDDHVGKPGNSHRLVQIGVLVMVVSGVVLAFLLVGFVGAMIAAGVAADAGGEPPEEAMIAAILGSIGMLILAGIAFMGGRIALLVGKYRIWQEMETQERARQHAQPINVGLLLALSIGAIFLGGLGSILAMIVGYITQERLNAMWQPTS